MRCCGILDRKASTGSPAWTLGPQPTFQRWNLAKRKRVHWGWDLRLYTHFLFTVCIVTDSMWPRHQPLMPSWLPCQDGMQAINCKQKWTVPPRRWFLLDQSNENCNWYNSGCRKVSLQTGVKMVSAKKEKRKKKSKSQQYLYQHQSTKNSQWQMRRISAITIDHSFSMGTSAPFKYCLLWFRWI